MEGSDACRQSPYTLLEADRSVPSDWQDMGITGTRPECLAAIEQGLGREEKGRERR